jgi:hypothetical protein
VPSHREPRQETPIQPRKVSMGAPRRNIAVAFALRSRLKLQSECSDATTEEMIRRRRVCYCCMDSDRIFDVGRFCDDGEKVGLKVNGVKIYLRG